MIREVVLSVSIASTFASALCDQSIEQGMKITFKQICHCQMISHAPRIMISLHVWSLPLQWHALAAGIPY